MKFKKLITLLSTTVVAGLFLLGCSSNSETENSGTPQNLENVEMLHSESNGVYYEIFVRAFADSDGDGLGDLNGIISKLDYLEELGIEGIWLMPINPSPSYHGYDVTDYRSVNEQYGTTDDMKALIKEAHERDIKILMDLVVNHTSRSHPWFEKAMEGDPKYEDYFVWASEDTNTSARGEWNQSVWHRARNGNYYEAVFWDGMPDLNFENPEVRNEIHDIGRFWLEEVGVDGFRLDAAKHIYSSTSSEIDEENDHKWWREFRDEMEKAKSDVILLGEVWDAPTVAGPYLEDGLTSTFNFDLAGKILQSASSEKDAGLASYLTKIRDYFSNVSGGEFTDSTFITNHDMNRVMSELNGNINQGKMAASLLLTLPGRPFIYYGEETGLYGEKPDEEIREPFLWKRDENATEQTSWRKLKHNKDFETLSVEAQLEDENSMLNHYKRMIHLRRSSKVLMEGEIDSSLTKEKGIASFKRILDDESMLVLHNLSGDEMNFELAEKESDYTEIYYKTKQEIEVTNNEGTILVKLPPYSSVFLTN
ncbi:alpha-amylase [Paraliobacillus quinghaiensis]|uniref:Alpha-amylase n=1 Tax=Paraliobacillus quinghaiensis TaxID=470815 RepID=A0A917WWA3_9BACI|nr:alpha-amylase family glycosyl hydrolase [Paraliobacillus quinghaiensis]GGM38667.1 alpha-amylase [Paraliobacillus quinghaiensis]